MSRVWAADPVAIEVGTWSAEYGREWLTTELTAFQEAYSDVSVSTVSLFDPSRYKNPVEKFPRLAENVIAIDSESGYETVYFVERDMLVPIEDFLPDPDFDFDSFYPKVFDSVRYQGKTWGVPWTYWTAFLVIDEQLFNESKIPLPQSWKDVHEAARKLTKDRDGDGQVDQWGMRLTFFDESTPYAAVSKVLQDGGHVMKNGMFDINHPAFIDAFEFFGELANDRSASKLDARQPEEFLQDQDVRYAMFIIPSFDLPQIENRTDLRVMPLPTDKEKVCIAECRRYFAIRKSTPQQEMASWKFVKWMTREGISLPTNWDVFPCRSNITGREDFRLQSKSKIQGLAEALTTNSIAVDPGDPVYGRRDALIYIVSGLAGPMVEGQPLSPIVEKIEIQANTMIRQILPDIARDSPR
ncbi:MAG: hypothetical protein AMXMBFR82_07140 [Candidatus Hydrogenedentota bacterium]